MLQKNIINKEKLKYFLSFIIIASFVLIAIISRNDDRINSIEKKKLNSKRRSACN